MPPLPPVHASPHLQLTQALSCYYPGDAGSLRWLPPAQQGPPSRGPKPTISTCCATAVGTTVFGALVALTVVQEGSCVVIPIYSCGN